MALKAVHVSDVPTLDQVPEGPTLALAASLLPKGAEPVKSALTAAKFAVIGHRGKGMNALASLDRRMREIKENSIRSFNEAGRFAIDFVEFDVQVTKDDCPIIFHDNFLLAEENGNMSEKRVTDLSLEEFLSYGPQKESGMVVFKFNNERPIFFSSFQPDAAQLMRKLQNAYPVFFLTNGGTEIYSDVRRNSLDEAIKLCLDSGLHGIVSEVKAIFRNPSAIHRIKESNLSLLTYGQLNNVPEAVYMQHLMGINGVIADLVQTITEALSEFISPEGDKKVEVEEVTKPDRKSVV